MVSMDIFHQDPFNTIQLTTAIEKVPYLPTTIRDMNLFAPDPIRTKAAMVEERDGQLVLIKTSPRGTGGTQRTTERRTARYFSVPRLRHEDTINADEIQGIRAFGSETELMQVQSEVARRLAGPTGIIRNIEYTWEYHQLGAIQGILLDADGSVINNWFDEFGISQPAEIPFDLTTKTEGTLRPICDQIGRATIRAAKGAFIIGRSRVQALCGDTFWDEFITHPDVEKTFLNWSAAQDLRDGGAFTSMSFGGIDWLNYRGSDDNSTIAIGTSEVKFFPKNAPGIFKCAFAPGESFEWVNTLGKPIYARIIYDTQRNEWVQPEVSSYPLHMCTRPETLNSGRAGA